MSFNNYFKFIIVWAILALCASAAWAQNTVTGTVTGDGEPLEGVTVIVKGTNIGTYSNASGKYTVAADTKIETLLFRYVGYQDQEIAVNGRSTIDITMSGDLSIDEVVVTGYGTAKAKEVTSAITSVKVEDFNRGNVNDPSQLIQGKVPGLVVSRPGGDPNGDFTLRLRGLSTIGQNAEPLIIIDGVIGASLRSVDPSDIQSIDILKDGSAAAIYGTRGSSGVIIITTKKGLAGTSKVEYNGYVTAEVLGKTVETMSPDEFRGLNDLLSNAGSDLRVTDFGENTDWIDEVTRTGVTDVHNLSLSGGTRQTTYRASLNVRDARGVGINTGFLQLNGRLNLTQKALNDKLTITTNVTATTRDADLGFEEAFRYAVIYNPTAPVFAEDPTSGIGQRYGGYFQSELFDYFNPVAIAEQNINRRQTSTILMSIRGDYELFEGFKIGAFYSQQRENGLDREYYDKQSYFRGTNRNGLANRRTADNRIELLEGTATYNTDFGDNNSFEVLGGYSYQDQTQDTVAISGGNFISDDITFNNLGIGQDFARGLAGIGSYRERSKIIAFFGRVRLNIDDTYFLMASYRHEGSTRFGTNNKWGGFPAVSAGVTLSNLFDINKVDFLKLRAGFGVTGSLPARPYQSILRYGQSNFFLNNGNFVPAIGPQFNANPNLAWESKNEISVGLDFSMFNYKLNGSLDFYNRVTNDLIYDLPVPVPPNVAPTTFVNLDDVSLGNIGFEANIGYDFKSGKNFSWRPSLNFATFQTKLNRTGVENPEFSFFNEGEFFDPTTSPGAPGLNNLPTVRVAADEELGQLYGLQYEGVDDAGNFIFADLDGDGIAGVDADGNFDEDDKTVIGNGLPAFNIGFANTFNIGKFDINFFLRGDFGHDLINFYRVFYESNGSRSSDNKVTTRFYNEDLVATPNFSSYYVEDASYLALDNATVGYTFDMGENSSFSDLRIYVSGQNLFFITSYTGVDPSVRFADPGPSDNGGTAGNAATPNLLAPGLDRRSTYFRTMSFTFGVNASF